MSTLEDYEKQERAKAKEYSDSYAASARATASQTNDKIDRDYTDAVNQTTASYNTAKKDTAASYHSLYDANAVDELVRKRQIDETLANMGLTDSGVMVGFQSGIQRRRQNNDRRVTEHKQESLKALDDQYAAVIKEYDAWRASEKQRVNDAVEKSITEVARRNNEIADENARILYEEDQKKAQWKVEPPTITISAPEAPPDPLQDIHKTVAIELGKNTREGMTAAWNCVMDAYQNGTLTLTQMNDIMREYGILSPSQQEYYTDREGDFRYQVPMSSEQLQQIAKGERGSEISLSSVDEAFINNIFADHNTLVQDLQTLGYDNAAKESKDAVTMSLDLQKRAAKALGFLEENRELFTEEDYTALKTALEGIIQNQEQIREAYKTYADTVSGYSTKEEYEQAMADNARYEELATLDLEGTAGTFLQKTDIVSRQTDRDALYEKLVKDTAADLRADYTARGLVGTSHLDYEEMARKQIDSELEYMATLDPHSAEYHAISGSDLYRIAEYDRVNNEALARFGYDDYATFKADYDEEDHTRKAAAYTQKGITLYEDATSADDFSEKSQYDPKIKNAEYRFINGESLSAKAMDTLPAVLKNIRQYMSADEIAVYNYYYVTKGKEAADKYLRVIEDALTSRKASELFTELDKGWLDGIQFKDAPMLNNVLDVVKKTVNEKQKYRFGVLAGLDQFAGGIKNAVSGREDHIPASALQKTSVQVRDSLYGDGGLDGTLKRLGYNAITTGANMAPSVLASVAATYLTTKATGNVSLAGKVGKTVGNGLMMLSTKGNAYADAINQGYTKEQAQTYSTLIALSEGCLQAVLGGIPQLGGVSKAFYKAIDSVDNAIWRIPLKMSLNGLSEGTEEAAQQMLEPLFKYIATGDREKVDWGATAESFLIGGLIGEKFSLPQIISSNTGHLSLGNVDLKNAQIMAGLKDFALQLPEGSKAYALAQNFADGADTSHATQLFTAICQELDVSEKVGSAAILGNTLRMAGEQGDINLSDAIPSASNSDTSLQTSTKSDAASPYNAAPMPDLSKFSDLDIRTDQLLMAQNPNVPSTVNTDTTVPTVTAPKSTPSQPNGGGGDPDAPRQTTQTEASVEELIEAAKARVLRVEGMCQKP